MSYQSPELRIAILLEQIQDLHAKARQIAEDNGIPFEIELDNGRNQNTTAEYSPWDSSDVSWSDSGCSY